MLLRLYSAYKDPNVATKSITLHDVERPRTNGVIGLPIAGDRAAVDAQDFELEGLISDDEREHSKTNGKPIEA